MTRRVTDIVTEGEALGKVAGILASVPAGLTTEQLQDAIAAFITDGGGVTVTYDDVAGSLTIAGGTVAVEDAGTEIVAAATRFDFTGDGVTVTDSGAGQATVNIPSVSAVLASASTALTTHTPSNTTAEQWGTEEATIAQASAPASAVVMAWLTGSAGTSGTAVAGNRGEVRLEVSFDGGATWATLGDAGIIVTVPSTNAGTRTPVTATGRAAGSVTGDIQVRAMCRDVDTSGTLTFADGQLVVIAHPS